jgi:hypothetical protein
LDQLSSFIPDSKNLIFNPLIPFHLILPGDKSLHLNAAFGPPSPTTKYENISQMDRIPSSIAWKRV